MARSVDSWAAASSSLNTFSGQLQCDLHQALPFINLLASTIRSPTWLAHDRLHSSRCCWFLLLSVPCRLPFDPLQIEYKNRVENRYQEQGNEGCDGESADLGIAQGFPERAAFECERKQSKNRCAHGDHHGTNAFNSGIGKSTLQRLAHFLHLHDEVQ